MQKGLFQRLILTAAAVAFLTATTNAMNLSERITALKGGASKAEELIDTGLKRFNAKDISGAIEAFERASQANSKSANAFFHLANAYYHRAFTGSDAAHADKDDVRNAIDAYETASAIDPALGLVDDPFLLYHGLSQCYEAAGNLPQALLAVRKATQLARKNPMPYLYGARIRYKLKDLEKSAENLVFSVRRARRINKYPALAKMVKENPLFSGLLESPRNKLILEVYDAVHAGTLTEKEAQERIAGFQPYRDALTNSAMKTPRTAETPREDDKVSKLVSDGHRAYDTAHYRDAVEAYRAALEEDSEKGTLNGVEKSLILERVGSSYRHLGLVDEAVKVFQLAISEMPHNTAAHYQLSLSYSVNGELGKAMTSLNQALDSAHSMTMLRKTLLMAKTDPEFEPIRELPRFSEILKSHSNKLSARR